MTMQNATSDKPTSSDVARYRANYLAEQEGSYLYRSSPRPRAIPTWQNSIGGSLVLSNVTPTCGRTI